MILSDIVSYKTQLNNLSSRDVAEKTSYALTDMINQVSSFDIDLAEHIEDLDTASFVVSNVLGSIDKILNSMREVVQQSIDDSEPDYFSKSMTLYNNMAHEESTEILNRAKPIRGETDTIIRTRIGLYTDWRYPGMIIRPATESHIKHLVPLDPLYIVDTNDRLLLPVREEFTPEYQARLRYYTISEYVNQPIFQQLPVGQFGMIFSHNYFQYKPLHIIKQYLDEIFVLLRDSGVFMFTYNDCDYTHAVRLAEKNFHCYTPGRMIKDYAVEKGFDIVFEHHSEDGIHFLELVKPGEARSIRGGQTLARIVPRSDKKPSDDISPKDVDNHTGEVYNKHEALKLRVTASLLGIDTEDNIFGSMYTLEKLARLVKIRMDQGGIEIAKFNEKLERKINKRKKS